MSTAPDEILGLFADLPEPEQRLLLERLHQEHLRPSDQGARSARSAHSTEHWAVRVGPVAMGLAALVLIPWTIYLMVDLPRHYVVHHWISTWVVFDLVLCALMAATSISGFRRHWSVVPFAFATGILLACDAWFDVSTASRADASTSMIMALAVELPSAALLIWASTRRMAQPLRLRWPLLRARGLRSGKKRSEA